MKRKFKLNKFMSVLLSFLLILGCVPAVMAADEPTVTLTADKTEVLKGETVTLTLSIDKDWEDAYLWQWNIVWDSTYFDATKSTTGGANAAYKYTSVNLNATTYYDAPYKAASVAPSSVPPEPYKVKAGTLATVTLTAKQDITGSHSSKIYVDAIKTQSGESYYDEEKEEWKVRPIDKAIINSNGEGTPVNVTVMAEKPVSEYDVTLGEDLAGEATVEEGKDYTFTLTKADGYNYTITATMGGEAVDFTEKDGTYTIAEVTGDIVVTVKKTAKQFNVTLGEDMTGADKATYGEDYSATLTKDDNYTYEVKVTIAGEAYTGFGVENDVYTVPGVDISGDIVFTVVKTEIPPEKYEVTFEGTGAGELAGEKTATEGEPYTFTLTKAEGYNYEVSATMGGKAVELTEAGGTYTVAEVTGDIVVTVAKTAKEFGVTLGTDMTGEAKATFGEAYTAKLTKAEGYNYEVSATMGGKAVELTEAGGEYTIANVTGDIVFTVTKTEILPEEYDVTFQGTGKADVNGEAKATEGDAYTFTLTKAEGYNYTVSATMGGKAVELTEASGEYTIANVTGDIVFTVTKTAKQYNVTLGTDMTGEAKATFGEAYTAKLTKAEGYNYTVSATMGGEAVELTEEDGIYTIAEVTGNIVISVAKTAKEYDVTLGTDMTGDTKAAHGEDYTAQLNKEDGYEYVVTAKMGGRNVDYTEKDGVYTIKNVTGAIEFTVTKTKVIVPAKEFDITFMGTGKADAQGEAKVTEGEDYTFTLTKAEGYEYTVDATIGGKTAVVTEKDGVYTIKNVDGDVVVTIGKEVIEQGEGEEPGEGETPGTDVKPDDDTNDNKNESPETGDSMVVYMAFAAILVLMIVLICKKRRMAE